MIVVFDSETSQTNNLEIDADYKSNRIDYSNVIEEENPFSQLPMIKNALDYLDIFHMEIENYEADDFIASIICFCYFSYVIIIINYLNRQLGGIQWN